MTWFILNLVLAVMFGLMFGAFDPPVLLAGFIISFLLLMPISRAMTGRYYGGSIWRVTRFTFYFIRILVIANIGVAKEVITPGFTLRPRIVRFDVSDLNDLQMTTLANAITLTPGTLAVDVSKVGENGQRYLYIHCMFGADREAALAELQELRDRLVREVFAK